MENTEDMEIMEEMLSWKVKRFWKYWRKVGWIVERFGKYGRKVSWIVKRYGKSRRKK